MYSDVPEMSNGDYAPLSRYHTSVPIPQEWLYQYSIAPKNTVPYNMNDLETSKDSRLDYMDTSIMFNHGFNPDYQNPYSKQSYGEFNVYATRDAKSLDLDKYLNNKQLSRATCNNAYPTTEMVFRQPKDLTIEKLATDPNRNQVIKQLDLLKRQYIGVQSNLRKPAGVDSQNPMIPFKRGEFAWDHSTIVSH